ncbi:response regulator [Glaciihabitans sp. UYNi722]|uniref:response regulator transcription factor n=1 Tax=Glaciihabitans sp. UYNi722 TaxID=3156344 RepID=UPI00339AC736
MTSDSSFAVDLSRDAALRPVRVLIVDEEEPLTKVIKLALGLEGWQIEVAVSGEGALAAVESFHPDAILLDIMLPDMSGIVVASTLRERGDSTPILFVTGRSSLDDKIAAFAAGGDDYLTKPFSLEDAVSRLTRVFRRSGLMASSMVVGEIVLDQETGDAWRAGDALLLDPVEFELLRILVSVGEPLAPHEISAQLRKAGVSESEVAVSRALHRLLDRTDGDESSIVRVSDAGEWRVNA